MKRSRRLRKGTAVLLAAGMVLTMLAPAAPAYADTPASNIFFDTGEGPKAQFEFADGNPGTQPEVNGKIGLTGQTFSLIKNNYSNLKQFNPNNTAGDRPALPGVAAAWEGYKAGDGGEVNWYLPDGYTKLAWLPYAFQPGDITYHVKWESDGTLYDFKTEDQLELSPGRVLKYHRPESRAKALDTVTGFAKSIPGFKVATMSNAPKNRNVYGKTDHSGASTGSFDKKNNSFTGTMPNEPLTLTYTYGIDTDKKFNAIAKYVKSDGTKIANDSAPVTKAVGETFTLEKADVPGYTVQSAAITSGMGADPDNRILSLEDVNGGPVGDVSTGQSLTAKMPNQDVIVTYKYQWASAEKTVVVNFIGPDGEFINSETVHYIPQEATGIASASVAVPYTDKDGQPLVGIRDQFNASYDTTVAGTDIEFNDGDATYRSEAGQQGKLDFRAGLVGGKVNINYVADVTDNDYYSTVTYVAGENGKLPGDKSPQRKAKGIHTFKQQTQEQVAATGQTWGCDLTSGVIVEADEGYRFAGWKKAGPSHTPIGDFLQGDFDLQGNVELVAVFEEDPSMWANLTFHAVNGTVDQTSVRALVGSNVEVTATKDQAGYVFTGWYDGPKQDNNIGMSETITISVGGPVDQMYTAKFSNPVTAILPVNIPNAAGVIDAQGNGKIQVDGALPDRTYVITDSARTIVAVRSGAQLKNRNDFGKLTPGTSYCAYETTLLASLLVVGETLAEDPQTVSAPRNLTIAAVGGNVKAAEDPVNADKALISVSPAAENTVYSLLDESGTPVTDWITPQGSPSKVEFSSLEPGAMYTVVATAADKAEAETPAQKQDGGVQVAADSGNSPSKLYEIQVTGGTVVSVDGAAVDAVTAQAKPGVPVKVAADGDNMKWTALMGKVPAGAEHNKSFTFEMPAGNVILVAAAPVTGTPSNAEVTSNVVGSGQVALDPELLAASRAAMTTVTDQILIDSGKKISYNVTFKKYTPVASVSNAVKAETAPDNDAYQTDWAIDVSAVRTDENGVSRPADEGSVHVITQVDSDALGNTDYQLCEITADGTVGPVNMDNPVIGSEDNAGGLVRFQANVGSTYVLGYSKRIEVTLKDTKRAGEYMSSIVHVNKGGDLYAADEYTKWLPEGNQVVTDAYYDYVGLSRKANAYAPYEETAVDKRLTLYAWYDVNPDWKAAKDELEGLVNTAYPLLGSGNITQEDRDRLQAAINDATDKLGQNPALSIEELGAVYDGLYQLIEEITGGQPQPPNPGGGGGSGGGSGGGGGGSSAGRSYSGTPGGAAAYRAGTDGNWELLDAANHKWAFGLNSGKQLSGGWYRITDTVNGLTNTGWYNFADDHTMRDGWITDRGKWYYLNQKHDGWFGRMVTGWHYDDSDHRWYYLDQTGAMVTGWQTIDGKSYYFSESSAEPAWQYNQSAGAWEYANLSVRPYGSMYAGERTPDGHTVDQNGALAR